jgi:hypothetical protein
VSVVEREPQRPDRDRRVAHRRRRQPRLVEPHQVLLTRRDVGVGLMRGQKLVAVAAYAGRGLVIFGTVSGTEWVPWTEPHSIYKQAIPVEWEPVIYS